APAAEAPAPATGAPAPGAGERIARLTSLYAALSRTNEAIFRESDPQRLCRAVCEIAVTYGGLTSASIRLYDEGRENLVLLCGYGALSGWVGERSLARDDPHSRAAKVAREQRRHIVADILTNFASPEARDDAVRLGVRSSGGLPLSIDGVPAGVFSVYAAAPDYFDDELAGLLDEMARNISFAFAKARADAAVRHNADHYRKLFDSMPMGIRVLSDERVVVINPAGLRMLGLSSEREIIGRPVYETIAPRFHELARERIGEVMRSGTGLPPSEQALLRADGAEVPIEVTSLPFEYEGRPAVISVLRTLYVRHANQRRIARLTRLNTALSRMNEAIFRLTGVEELCQKVCEIAVVDGGLVSAAIRAYNPVLHQLEPYCGYGPLRGRLGADTIRVDDPHSYSAGVARDGTRYVHNDMINGPGRTASVEDAEALGVRASAGFALSIDSELAGVLSVFAGEVNFFDDELVQVLQEMAHNLSFAFTKIRAETELKRSQEHYRMLFDATPEAFRVICDGRMVMLNPAGARLLGYATPEDGIGQLAVDAVLPEKREASLARNARVLRERVTIPLEETTLVRTDGSMVDVEVLTLPFEFEGRPAVLSIARDLTVRKAMERAALRHAAELEETVQRRTAELKQANTDLETFSYTVAHDLRAPLRRMTGFAGLLKENLGPRLEGEDLLFLDRIAEGGATMGRLIEGLLELAHLGRAELRPLELDLSGEVRSIAHELHVREPARDVEFVIAPGITAWADPRLIHNVLDNLLGNAWKFTSNHAHARIEFGECTTEDGGAAPCAPDPGPGNTDSVTASAGQRVYFVRDDGAGFDMHYAAKLFGTFQRLHAHNEFAGTGIGLASVKRIITHHGGRVWAHGEVDKGATFYFSLPRAGQRAA
ncbi:MAG: sensor signal transduction histidine kinase, partial [Betaproteobacteria bacterium]|nr:sensor signal transduction histidine kinase [Betaproteobacteria bacterium]